MEASLDLWSKGPLVEFYHPTAVSAQSLTGAGWPIFSHPGVIKNVLRLIYTRLLEHDIIIGMHYHSRLLSAGCVRERPIVRCWKPLESCDRKRCFFCCLFFFLFCTSQKKSQKEKMRRPSVHYVMPVLTSNPRHRHHHPPFLLGCDPKLSFYTSPLPGRWRFLAEAAVFVFFVFFCGDTPGAEPCVTCCTPASVVQARLAVI